MNDSIRFLCLQYDYCTLYDKFAQRKRPKNAMARAMTNKPHTDVNFNMITAYTQARCVELDPAECVRCDTNKYNCIHASKLSRAGASTEIVTSRTTLNTVHLTETHHCVDRRNNEYLAQNIQRTTKY